jgi:thioredoxin reductase
MDSFKEHAISSGSEIINEMVSNVTKHDDHFHIVTAS